jgi:hypothetical protein
MWSRHNVPLLIMSMASAGILCFFAVSVGSIFSAARQLDACGWSKQVALGPI